MSKLATFLTTFASYSQVHLTGDKSGEVGTSRLPLALNQACAAKEAAGETITPGGLPLPEEDRKELVTRDCISIEM